MGIISSVRQAVTGAARGVKETAKTVASTELDADLRSSLAGHGGLSRAQAQRAQSEFAEQPAAQAQQPEWSQYNQNGRGDMTPGDYGKAYAARQDTAVQTQPAPSEPAQASARPQVEWSQYNQNGRGDLTPAQYGAAYSQSAGKFGGLSKARVGAAYSGGTEPKPASETPPEAAPQRAMTNDEARQLRDAAAKRKKDERVASAIDRRFAKPAEAVETPVAPIASPVLDNETARQLRHEATAASNARGAAMVFDGHVSSPEAVKYRDTLRKLQQRRDQLLAEPLKNGKTRSVAQAIDHAINAERLSNTGWGLSDDALRQFEARLRESLKTTS